MAHTEPCEILTAIPKSTALPSQIFLFVHTPECFMYLLGTLHRMLAQLIKFGLVLECFVGMCCLIYCSHSQLLSSGGGEDYSRLGEV